MGGFFCLNIAEGLGRCWNLLPAMTRIWPYDIVTLDHGPLSLRITTKAPRCRKVLAMAGISDFKRQIEFVLGADQRREGAAIAAVLTGIWELTAADPELGAKVGEQIIVSSRTGAIYYDHHSILYGLVLRGWTATQDYTLEARLAELIHSSQWGESAREKIANRFSEFLKDYEAQLRKSGEYQHGARIPMTLSESQHRLKLTRFIVTAGDHTTCECVKIAANAYLRFTSPAGIRKLFVN